MQFICVHHHRLSPNVLRLLEVACHHRHLDFVAIEASSFDYTQAEIPREPYLLYNASTTASSRLIQYFLLQPHASTFFRSLEMVNSDSSGVWATIKQAKVGIPMPRTIYSITRDRAALQHAVEHLGGFPLVAKVIGGSHGIGVMKVDSLAALYSLADYLAQKEERVMLRQFINVTSSARLIVLAGRVIDSIEYRAPAGDFRTNSSSRPTIFPQQYSAAIERVACRAVAALGLEFGGVDILIDHAGQPYVTEVNFPCSFTRAQLLTGTDIAGQMIDHLRTKATSQKFAYTKLREHAL